LGWRLKPAPRRADTAQAAGEPEDGPPAEGEVAEFQVQTAKPTASSLIAEMWSEREQSIPRPPVPDAPAPHPGRDRQGNSRTGLVVAVVALALLLGGGAGVFMATQGVGMPPTAKFVAKADAVCRPANGAVLSIVKPTSYPDLATAAGTLATSTGAQLGSLRKMTRPGGADGGRVASMFSSMTETDAAARSLQDAAGRKDDVATAAATQRVRLSAAEASTTARQVGFTACATGMQTGVDAVTAGGNAVVKTAFLAKADSLCRASMRELETVVVPKSGNAAIGRYLTQTLQIVQKWVGELKALPVPPGDEATVADIITSLDKVTAKWAEAPGAASAGDRSRFEAISREMSPLNTAADAKLDAYGLSICGSNFGG